MNQNNPMQDTELDKSPQWKLSFHLKAEDFLPASEEEKEDLVTLRESVSFWQWTAFAASVKINCMASHSRFIYDVFRFRFTLFLSL